MTPAGIQPAHSLDGTGCLRWNTTARQGSNAAGRAPILNGPKGRSQQWLEVRMTCRTAGWWGMVVLTVLVLLGDTKPVAAEECFQNLKDCYIAASHMRYWVDRWAAGLDCELDFVDCTRQKILGR